jgi:hypothetical protein
MTPQEFQSWFARTMNVLPDLQQWYARCNQEQQDAVLDAWERALHDVELRDAKAVVYLIVAGDLQLGDAKGFYERQLFAASVRRHARDLVSRRMADAEKRKGYERRKEPSKEGEFWKAMYRYVSKANADGVDKEIWLDKGMRILSGEKFDDIPETSRIEEAP